MIVEDAPRVGEIVHYVSRGSADGKFPSVCRAAIVTETYEVGDEDEEVDETYPVSLAVFNPTGTHFDHDIPFDTKREPGTYHDLELCSG